MPNLSSLEQVAELPKLSLISVQEGNQQLCKKKKKNGLYRCLPGTS